ncbi:MAG: hypothetical protein RQ751_09815, partial [Longimicrobiales bacterium]|nr:hypothetical protein [Longimicrobiales bacterium]
MPTRRAPETTPGTRSAAPRPARNVAAFAAATLATALTATLTTPAPATAQEPNFGRAVVLQGNELFVGQPVNWYGPGAVYAYGAGTDGIWEERALLTASDSSRMDDFGRALAVDGNTLVVGAPRKRDGAGVAYAFQRPSPEAPWRESAVLTPPAGEDASEFAVALALADDELLVGAPAVAGAGVVYRYRRSGGGWALEGAIRPPVDAGVAGFGGALARDGDRLLVGAAASDSARGRVYAVERRADGGWEEPHAVELAAGVVAPGTRIGAALALAGERALVGAPGASRVHILERDEAGAWRPTGMLRPEGDERGSRFGSALALTVGEAWVGAPGVQGGNGRVFRFAADGPGAWQPLSPVEPDDTTGTSWPLGFGYALDADGERAVVGMPTRDFGEGRALALRREGGDWRPAGLLEGRIFTIGSALTPGARCVDGALGEFPCTNMELVAHLPVSALG